ncbi:MAG: helix-turn-helix domain-containing protein [Pirellulaceae bacterium]
MTNQYQTVPSLAKELGVNADKVRGWIASGELLAVNVGNRTRPRWRIAPQARDAFLAARAASPPPPPRRRQRSLPQVRQWV